MPHRRLRILYPCFIVSVALVGRLALQEHLIEAMRKLPPHEWGPFFTQHSDNPQIRKLEEGLKSLSDADKHLFTHMFSRVFHRPPGRDFRGRSGRRLPPELRKPNQLDGPRRGTPPKGPPNGPSRRRHIDAPDSLGPDSKSSPREGLRPQRPPRRGSQPSKETRQKEFRRRGADPLPPDPDASPEGSLPPVRPDTTWQEPLSGQFRQTKLAVHSPRPQPCTPVFVWKPRREGVVATQECVVATQGLLLLYNSTIGPVDVCNSNIGVSASPTEEPGNAPKTRFRPRTGSGRVATGSY